MTERIRTVITTDGEVDDMNSFIRALYYSNDMDICGIVLTASMYHYAGNAEKGIAPYRWTGIEWVNCPAPKGAGQLTSLRKYHRHVLL